MFKHCVEVEIDCAIPSDVLMGAIQAACESSEMYAIRKVRRSAEKMQFLVTTGNWMFRNSFLPQVTVIRQDGERAARVVFECRLPLGVRVILMVYWLLLGVFEVGMLISSFSGAMEPTLLLGLPIGMALFLLLLSFAGFKLSSKAFLNSLFSIMGW